MVFLISMLVRNSALVTVQFSSSAQFLALKYQVILGAGPPSTGWFSNFRVFPVLVQILSLYR